MLDIRISTKNRHWKVRFSLGFLSKINWQFRCWRACYRAVLMKIMILFHQEFFVPPYCSSTFYWLGDLREQSHCARYWNYLEPYYGRRSCDHLARRYSQVFSSSIRFNICQLVTGQPTLLVDHLIRELWPNFTWNYWKSSCRSDEYFKWEPSQHFLTCSNSHFSMPPSPTSKDEMLAFIVKYLSSWKGLARHFRTTTVVDKHGLHFHSWITCVGSVQ